MTAMNRMPSGYKVNCCAATREGTLGYKQTEVGVIPVDWNVMQFGELAAPRKERVDPKKSGIHEFCIELEHVGQSSGRLLGSTNTGVSASLKTVFQVDDVLFGKLRAYLRKYWLAESEGVCSTEIWALVANPRLATPSFVYQVVTSDSFIEAASNSYGTHMPRSDWNLVKNCTFATPPLPEQRAIATVLSDVDALLAAQDKLVAKKRDIKQAAMQQLLTGKQRLPGFSGEWEVKRLREECELITKGTTPTSLGKDFTSSGINFIKIETLEENGKIIKDKVAFIDAETNNFLKRSQLREKDILVSIAGALGRVAVVEADLLPANTNQALAIVRLKLSGNIDHGFLFYYLNSLTIKKYIEAINVQAAQANLSLVNVGDFTISFPSLPEQTAIATILSDMDADLTALEQQRDKTRALKQGMMQELLTGRIRLK